MSSKRANQKRVASWVDAGWLYLISGLAVLGATVLIPAGDNLAQARLQQGRAEAIEARSAARLRLHSDYLDALTRSDATVVRSLAQTQLNATPAGMRVVYLDAQDLDASFDASVVRGLEPEPTPLPELRLPETMLRQLASNDRIRLWMLAGGAMCVLIGLLPPTRVRTGL